MTKHDESRPHLETRPSLLDDRVRRSEPQGQEILDIVAVFRTIWRRRWLVLFVIALAVAAAAVYAYRIAVPMYETTGTVMLQNRQTQYVDFSSVVSDLGGSSTDVNTEVQVLTSLGLLSKVVDQLDLTNDPEFNASLRPPNLTTWLRAALKNYVGNADAVTIDPDRVAKRRYENTVLALQRALTVKNIPLTYALDVTVQTTDPQKSVQIVNTLMRTYVEQQVADKLDATDQATKWLTDRVSETKSEVEQSDEAVRQFTAATEIVTAEGLDMLDRQIKDIKSRIDDLTKNLTTARAHLSALEAAQTRNTQAEIADDTQLDQLLPRAEQGDDAAKAAFDARLGQILSRLRVELQRTETQISSLQSSSDQLAKQLDESSQQYIKLQQLQREAEANRMLYEYFLNRLKETTVQQGIQQADSKVISTAFEPIAPASPRKPLLLAVAILLGATIGTGIVLLLEARNSNIRSSDDLKRLTGLTVMGQIQIFPIRGRRALVDYLAKKPNSAAVEAVRNLRTSLLLSQVDRPPGVIMVSSSMPGEGKTTISISLAHNFAGIGKRVLLVEGDIRRRTLNKYFELSKTSESGSGLIDVITGKTPLEEAVINVPSLGIDIVLGAKSAANAADLFASARFREFIDETRSKYDIVVIDTPPVLAVPDARVIGQVCDAILYAVHWDRTEQGQVVEGVGLFESVNLQVTGLVLSQIDPKRMRKYGYGGRYSPYYYARAKAYYDS